MSKKKDVTGRSRMARNLVGRWLGQIVVIVTGFVIPRLIGDNLGPVSLGIWDFGWSTVNYFRLLDSIYRPICRSPTMICTNIILQSSLTYTIGVYLCCPIICQTLSNKKSHIKIHFTTGSYI